MSAEQTRGLSAIIERQMRNWEIARQQAGPAAADDKAAFKPFVTVSRAVGCGGEAVAANLADRVKWPLFDRALLQYMAGEDGVRQQIYESLDERDLNFVNKALRQFLQENFNRDDYFHRLSEAVLSLARHAPAIIVGRGADLMLPRDHGLRVRLTAPLDYCSRQYAAEHQLDEATAMREIERIQGERAQFIQNHFRSEPHAINRYDITLNLAGVSQKEAVEVILAMMGTRGLVC